MLADYVGRAGLRDEASRWSPSPTSRAGTSSCPPSATPCTSSACWTRPDMVGVNPEVAHETMAGLSFHHGVGQALWAGKLFHIDLNGQDVGRYDQDFRFGAEDLKEAFLLVRLLERAGYDGPLHFDAHAYRNENAEGVWDFAAGCMRTYTALADAARALRRAARGRRRRWPPPPRTSWALLGGRRRRRHAQGGGGRARRPGGARLLQRAAGPAGDRRPARHAMSVIVGLDVGTSGVKAIAVSEDGEVVASAEVPYPLSTPRPGWSEQDPEDWWRATQEALEALGVSEVAGIGLSGQMHGLVALDESDEVVRPAILWNDQRTAEQCEEIERARRLRPARRADRQPRADRLHRAEAAVAARARAGELRADRPRAAPQGLRAAAAVRREGDRRRRRQRARCCSTSRSGAGATRC